MDLHVGSFVVAPMVAGAKPQPSQTIKPTVFLEW
jgi:hypothetical protein